MAKTCSKFDVVHFKLMLSVATVWDSLEIALDIHCKAHTMRNKHQGYQHTPKSDCNINEMNQPCIYRKN